MIKQITLRLRANEAREPAFIHQAIILAAGLSTSGQPGELTGYQVLKQSLDARSKTVWINLTLKAFINEPAFPRNPIQYTFRDVTAARKRVIIIGGGPAGLFAALYLLEQGIQPVILERGKDVRARRRDLAQLNKEGIVNPESNYCFGEGGAGTYSDGKLYTRSSKRGDIQRVLKLLHQFGADESVLYEAHPHIGTNKLPRIITAIREQIIQCGGLFLFEKKLVELTLVNSLITSVQTADGDELSGDAVILATGHSARDIFTLLHRKKILVEAKPFALGVRIEHPQAIIDSLQYHTATRDPVLPPASYSLVQQVEHRGVFSFCMCPGGIIAPAATNAGEIVVNGWSPSKRNNPYANSGMVVECQEQDVAAFQKQDQLAAAAPSFSGPLGMMHFQSFVEQQAFTAGGGRLVAPAQRMVDFTEGKFSAALPACSYLPGIAPADLATVLPPFVHRSLQEGFRAFGKKMSRHANGTGYLTNDAVVVATESRTSSPVRIPRNSATLEHPQVANLYPCGEGAGYAGGIVSAAMDGERVAAILVQKLGAHR